MGNKKDIGIVFKEQLNHLDKSPNDNGWNAIQTELDKKKKRRLFPFWFTYVGIFSAGILLSWLVFSDSFNKNDLFKSEEKSVTTKENKKDNSSLKNTPKNSENNIVNSSTNVNTKNKTEADTNKKEIISGNGNSETEISSSENKSYPNENKSSDSYTKKSIKNKKPNSRKPNSEKLKNTTFKSQSEKISSENNLKNENKIILSNSNLEELLKNTISEKNNSTIETELKNTEIKKNEDTENIKKINKDSLKIKREIVETTKNDSLVDEKEKDKSFTIFIYGSPTISGFASNNYTLDNRLKNNSKTSQITFSYGSYLCYSGTENFSFRIGFGKKNFKFITENAAVNGFNYSNISYSNGFSNATIYNQSGNAEFMTITQDVSYTEIPLEIKYKLLNRKIGLNAIVGFNYLALNKNEVSVQTTNGNRYTIGKTTDLLDRSFGVNIGFGFDYKLTKNIKFNVEPLFKYHFKDNQSNENLNSFSVNVLTGLEIKFGK